MCVILHIMMCRINIQTNVVGVRANGGRCATTNAIETLVKVVGKMLRESLTDSLTKTGC